MKVAVVQEGLDAARGGAETSTLELAGELAKLGCDVTLIGSGPAGDVAGCRYAPMLVGDASRTERTRRFLELADRFVASQSFDVVHAITPIAAADVYQPRGGTYRETILRSTAVTRPAWLARLKRAARRFNARQQALLQAESALLNRAEPPFVAALSDYVRRQVLELRPDFPAERLRVVFNGVSFIPPLPPQAAAQRVAVRAELDLTPESPLLLFAAHNFRLKGLRELLSVLPHVPEATLAVAGRDDAAPWRRRAERLGVAPRVRFLGPRDDLAALYSAADVLVHPTWYDPCSRVVLEALRCGLPAVTTRLNGAAEAIADPLRGRVIERPDDTAALADAVRGALASRGAGAVAPDAALADALSMARHARELLSLYREVK